VIHEVHGTCHRVLLTESDMKLHPVMIGKIRYRPFRGRLQNSATTSELFLADHTNGRAYAVVPVCRL